jgi:hypothetical protein
MRSGRSRGRWRARGVGVSLRLCSGRWRERGGAAYFDAITAPHKEFVLIKNSGHLALFTRQDHFAQELTQRVRAIVTGQPTGRIPSWRIRSSVT